MHNYVDYNGSLLPAEQSFLMIDNRAFRYGDAIFESIRITNGKPQFLVEHFIRISKGLKLLKMQLPDFLSMELLEVKINDLAKKNEIISDARVRVTIFRNAGGWYTPTDNSTSYVIEIYPIESVGYDLNFKGYTVDLFPDYRKQQNALSNIKTGNSLLYVLAGIHKTQQQLDDCILLNDNSHIIEATSSNIFAVKNGVLYTPPINEGCVDGVMRRKIIEIAQANRIAVYEISILQNVLLSADELFLTNATNGIRWIVAYKQKRYFNNTAKKLVEQLNLHILG
jgi:branched-chain amino acid aminotransferase